MDVLKPTVLIPVLKVERARRTLSELSRTKPRRPGPLPPSARPRCRGQSRRIRTDPVPGTDAGE
jgi:hypothetical protein